MHLLQILHTTQILSHLTYLLVFTFHLHKLMPLSFSSSNMADSSFFGTFESSKYVCGFVLFLFFFPQVFSIPNLGLELTITKSREACLPTGPAKCLVSSKPSKVALSERSFSHLMLFVSLSLS